MRLFEITQAYVELESLLEHPETNDDMIAGYLDECQGKLEEKATDIGKFIENLELTAQGIKSAEEKMADRRKSIENRVKSIKAYLLRNMQAADIHKIECPEFKISRQKNPASVVIDDEKIVPMEYWRQPETPPPAMDKRMILDHIKNGVCVDGAHLEQTERLVIK